MTYKNLIELKEQRPQLVKRLLNWGLQRKNKWGFKTVEELYKQQTLVEAEVELYLNDLVFIPTKFSQAKDKLLYWNDKLTDAERQAVGLLLPYKIDSYDPTKLESNILLKRFDFAPNYDLAESPVDKALLNNWYDGSYKILDEKFLISSTINLKTQD